jgi:predicted RNA binding protein YcfA (HicA-like mRNA interferase family)
MLTVRHGSLRGEGFFAFQGGLAGARRRERRVVKVKEVIRRIEEDGWVFVRRGGRASHRIFKEEGVASEITVSGVGNDEMSPGQLQDIRRKSGLPLR